MHPGEQPACLELDQGGGDEEELGGDVEVEALVGALGCGDEAVELDEVGVDDRGERHLVEVDLLPHDQVEQEIEGALEHRRAHLVGHHTSVIHLAGRIDHPRCHPTIEP